MRKQTKKIAFSVLFSMAMSLVAPSQLSAFAATKTFEYVDETTEESIKELALTKGEQVDLKPIGVSSYSNAKWTSSNTKVAVVDSKGMITAMAEGETTIKMTIGDGSDYTSTPVKVFVKDDREVTIGVSEEVFGYEMKNGTSVDFQFFGLLDGAESRYECEWTSTNPSVATVDSATGEVTAKNEGFTVLGLTLTNKNTKKEYEATPIAISVVKGTGISIATPTPKPSGIVRVTPTPKPTSVPSATATPTPVVTQEPEATVTPTPALEKVAYTANLVADNCILLDFLNKKVDYSALSIELHKIVELPDDYMTVMVSMESKLASNGTQINIYPADGEAFENNVKYIVKVNGEEKIINVAIGAPNRVEVSYECLGEDGKAYYYDEAMGLEVPVTLSYQLYYNMVNVTESYKNKGYIEYEFLKEYENVDLNEDVLNFYAKTYVTLKATFYYSDDDGEYKECKNTKPISIAAVKLPSYKVDGLVNWTIIDTEETTKINWDKPVQYTIAGAENQKVVALIADNYGKYYVTDERGVDEDKGIYYVGDGEQLFSIMGYRTEFNFKISESDFVIESDGSLLTYETVKQGNATLEIWYDANETKKEYAIYPLQVKEPRKLNGIQAEKTSVTLATSSISGYEDKFSQTQVEIILKDQYGKEWTGDYDLELTSNVTEVNDALNGSASDPAYLDGTTLYINAENIMEVTNRTNVSFTVTETETKRTAKVTVTLKKPKFADGGEIVVNSSQIGLKETTIPLIDVTGENEIAAAQLEIYKISNGVKVGLYDASQIVIQESANHKFTVDNCTAGQVYVLVLGPDKKPVKEAESVDSVGVWIDSSEDCVMINVSGKKEGDNSSLEFLQKGTYTVKVTSITSVTSNKVNKANVTPTSLYFTVEDNTSDVTFQSLRNKTTSIVVNSKDDKESVKQIVAELFRFRLGNKEWSDLTQDMITDVKFTVSKEYLVIHDVEFAIPYPGEDSNMSYQKVITGLNKAVSFDN